MTDYLTALEIEQLTGRTRHKAQLRQLARQGIPATTDADGRPLVLRAARDSIMSARSPTPKKRQAGELINWNAIRGPASAKH
jgi:hypothetical protein